MNRTVISLDCEANGLHGQIFAAAATLTVDGVETATWTARCPIAFPVDPWVQANVLPAIADLPETVGNYGHLLARWLRIHQNWGGRDALVIAHIPWPVEARFLWDAHAPVPFSGPFPLIDVGSMLLARGHDPTSTDAYLDARGISRPAGSAHHPLYDARAAALVFWDLGATDSGRLTERTP